MVENTAVRDILSWVVPILVFFAIWAFVFRRFAEKQGFGGLMSVGRSKAKIYVETKTKTSFADVAGVAWHRLERLGLGDHHVLDEHLVVRGRQELPPHVVRVEVLDLLRRRVRRLLSHQRQRSQCCRRLWKRPARRWPPRWTP